MMVVVESNTDKKELRTTPAGVVRVFFLLLLVFLVNIIPLHLLREPHCKEIVHLAQAACTGPAAESARDHIQHEAEHMPHPSCEHSIQICPKSRFNPVGALVLVALPLGLGTVCVEPPLAQLKLILSHRLRPLDADLPDGLQPRPPPLT